MKKKVPLFSSGHFYNLHLSRNLIKFEVDLNDRFMERESALQSIKPGTSGIWWHERNRGPLRKLPYIGQFGCMKFTRINLDKNMKPHFNDGIEIHYVESGKYDWEFDGKQVELLPGNLSVTAPWHLNGSPAGKMDLGRLYWIILKPELFSPTLPLRLGKWTGLSKRFQTSLGDLIATGNGIVIRKANVFQKYFTGLREELDKTERGYERMVPNLLENLLIDLYRHLECRDNELKRQNSFIRALKQTITKDISDKRNVEDLAQEFGMGKTKFTEEVKRLTGYPPASYILNIKIERAKELLTEEKNTPLSRIAYRCGFSSLQHFTASFTQRTGISPGKHRLQNLAVPSTFPD